MLELAARLGAVHVKDVNSIDVSDRPPTDSPVGECAHRPTDSSANPRLGALGGLVNPRLEG